MTITTTWRTGDGVARYVQHVEGPHFKWCEVGQDKRYDCARGICALDDLPSDVAQKAIDRRAAGVWPFYVDWAFDAQ